MGDPLTDDINARAAIYSRARVLPWEGLASGAILMLGLLRKKHWLTALGAGGVGLTVWQTIAVNREMSNLLNPPATPAATINGVEYFPPAGVFGAR